MLEFLQLKAQIVHQTASFQMSGINRQLQLGFSFEHTFTKLSAIKLELQE